MGILDLPVSERPVTATRSTSPTQRASLWLAVSVFVSAFLLFAVQPLVGKALLPWFGGSPAVWTTCMVFFQVLLVAGYAWAHWLQRFAVHQQLRLHAGLLGLALAGLGYTALAWRAPLLPDGSWRPADGTLPEWRALRVLLAGAGLPVLALAASSPLLQRWAIALQPARTPWRLYALSNGGSLLALLSYPFVIEPALPQHQQAWAWAGLFVVLSTVVGRLAVAVGKQRESQPGMPQAPTAWPERLRWLFLAWLPSVTLLAATNHLCQEVAAVPLLWVVPLALYLLSFMATFESDRWYRPLWAVPGLAVVLVVAAAMLPWRTPVMAQVVVFNLVVLAVGLVCHGELAKRRPPAPQLTGFYLSISVGGALGGICVGVLAPLLFDTFVELDLAILTCGALVFRLLRGQLRTSPRGRFGSRLAGNALLMVLAGLAVAHASTLRAGRVASSRTFYGTLRVVRDHNGPQGLTRTGLLHGATLHGMQVQDPLLGKEPSAYFTRQSGLGQAIAALRLRRGGAGVRIAVVGLGIGTLAAYAQPGDHFRFYELSPDVLRLAQDTRYFSYLNQSAGRLELISGDGRLALERESQHGRDGQLDLLVLDAFGSDAVPVHLLTREAFALYRRQLGAPDAVLAVNVLNRTLDLAPLIFRAAADLGLHAVHVKRRPPGGDAAPFELPSEWMLLSADPQALAVLVGQATPPPSALPAPWTDDFSNLAGLLKDPGDRGGR